VAVVTKDATSGWWLPQSAAEWTSLLAGRLTAYSNPTQLWKMQEASGTLADSIGTATLTASGSVAYQQAVTGWSTKAVVPTAGGANYWANNTDAGLSTGDGPVTLIVLAAITAIPAADRDVALIGDGQGHKLMATVNGGVTVEKYAVSGVSATGTTDLGTTVRPWVISRDTGITPTFNKLQSDAETVAPAATRCTSASKQIFFGGVVEVAPAIQYLYAAQFVGVSYDDTGRATLIDALKNGPAVSSVTVTPATASLTPAGTQALVATGTRADTSTNALTATATWTTSNAAVATVSSTGVVAAVAAGTATITATYTSYNTTAASGTMTVTVTSGGVTAPDSGAALPNSVLSLLRFDESLASVPPGDSIGALTDLRPAAVAAYPTTAAAMAAAVGYGTWTAGYLCDDLIGSGALAPAFGAPSFAAVSSPLYGLPGPLGAGDLAIGFDSSADSFNAGTAAFAVGTNDLVFAWVSRFSAMPPAIADVLQRGTGFGQGGYGVRITSAGLYRVDVYDTTHTIFVQMTTPVTVGAWHIGMVVVDRTAGTLRIAMQNLDGSNAAISAATSLTGMGSLDDPNGGQPVTISANAASGYSSGPPTTMQIASFWIGTGAGVALNMGANLDVAVANLRQYLSGTISQVVSAFCGFGRQLAAGRAFTATDIAPGYTLSTRDVTVQMILSWDMPSQVALGTDAELVVRGKGGSAAEYVSYGVELHVVNSALQIGVLRFWWQDSAGGLHVQLGGEFILPPAGQFMMLTAVRRWVDATHVELRYYAGGQLLAEFLSSDGDIGGGTTGTMTIGARYSNGTPGNFFCGVLDEIRVLNYELTAEEIGATWLRISNLQPRAYAAVKQLVQPGAPITNDPASRIQKLLRLAGHALGYAAAQAENMRANLLPDRAYGPALEQHERILGEAPKPTDSVSRRRQRLISHVRQKFGSSIPGVAATVADLLQIGRTQVQVIAFDNTIRDDFSQGLKTSLWQADPIAQWTIASSALRVQGTAGANLLYDTRGWYTYLAAAQGSRVSADGRPVPSYDSTAYFDGRESHFIGKIIPTTIPNGCEVGVCFYDPTKNNVLLCGLRNSGTLNVVTEQIIAGASTAFTTRAAATVTPYWLHLYADKKTPTGFYTQGNGPFRAMWSTSGPTSGYATTPEIGHPQTFGWMGFYARTFAGSPTLASGLDVTFDDVIMRNPFGARTLRFYVYRDPTLPGTPDIVGAEAAVRRLQQAHTSGHVITTKAAVSDTAGMADRVPAGGF
jgi:hypothetical protein